MFVIDRNITKFDKIVFDRCSVNSIIQHWICLFFINIIKFDKIVVDTCSVNLIIQQWICLFFIII